MFSFITKILKKPTPFFVGGIIGIIYSIPMIIYSFQLPGGASLGALLYMGLLFASTISIVFDLIISNYFKYLIIIAFELIISFSFYIYWEYQNRQIIVDLRQIKHDYLIIIDNAQGLKLGGFKNSGLFDKIYISKDTDVLKIDEKSVDYPSIRFLGSDQSGGVVETEFHKPEYNFEWSFIQLPMALKKYSDIQMDSLFKMKFPEIQLHNQNFKGY